MSDERPKRARAWPWVALTIALAVWNGVPALFSCQFTQICGQDGTQYQLLARNRLHGHTEVGDAAYTVRDEGRHPMWRPGLVWLEEMGARCLGSVRAGAALASGLGVTLLELGLLVLAWRCFGAAAFWLALLACVGLPMTSSWLFLRLTPYQGPEPWAGAAITWGLVVLAEALRRRSWAVAAAAGVIAGLAEWFRTGNLLVFAVPCAVYGLAALRQRDRRGLTLPGAALATFLVTVALGGLAVPTALDKTAANLWHILVEHRGLFVTEDLPNEGRQTMGVGGYCIVPGTQETYYDYTTRAARETTALQFLRENAGDIVPIYLTHLGDMARGLAHGLRGYTGDVGLVLFLLQTLLSLRLRTPAETHTIALAAGAVVQFLGPIVLIAGNIPIHYMVVPLPLFLVVAAAGAARLVERFGPWLRRGREGQAQVGSQCLPLTFRVGLAALLGLTAINYAIYINHVVGLHQEAREQQAAVDALNLQGRRVACRNMGWFIDRNIRAVLLPYATVPELEAYARAHDADGILFWEGERTVLFRATPYGSLEAFDRALRESGAFHQPRTSAGWRWYPLRREVASRGQHS
jgi:hypothetical protein